jgi:hypothetical protein
MPDTSADMTQGVIEQTGPDTGTQIVFHTYTNLSTWGTTGVPYSGNIFISDSISSGGPAGNFTYDANSGGNGYGGNIGIGSGSLAQLTNGDRNIAIGVPTNGGALNALTTGSQNTAIGSDSGLLLIDGTSNFFLGFGSGGTMQHGTNNVFIGGQDNTDGNLSNNVLIGVNITDTTAGMTNSITIGTGATGNGSNTITLGNAQSATLFTAAQVRCASLSVANSAAATVPGPVVAKIEVFDGSGTSLGFLPVYSSIT